MPQSLAALRRNGRNGSHFDLEMLMTLRAPATAVTSATLAIDASTHNVEIDRRISPWVELAERGGL